MSGVFSVLAILMLCLDLSSMLEWKSNNVYPLKAWFTMATVTENDLQELKDLIKAQSSQIATIQSQFTSMQSQFTSMQSQFTDFQTQITDVKISVGKVESTLQAQQLYLQKMPDLVEKVGELKNWKQIGLTLSGALLGALITYLAKSSNP